MSVQRQQRQLEDGPRAPEGGLGNMMVRLAVVGVKGSDDARGKMNRYGTDHRQRAQLDPGWA